MKTNRVDYFPQFVKIRLFHCLLEGENDIFEVGEHIGSLSRVELCIDPFFVFVRHLTRLILPFFALWSKKWNVKQSLKLN